MSQSSSQKPIVSPTPTPSPAPPSSSSSNHTVIGAVLGIVCFLVLGVVVFAVLRLRRRRPSEHDSKSFTPSAIDLNHPASHITPFGSPTVETPRFHHTPGSEMRIATRRADGAWLFADPQAPFTPSGVSDLESSPASSYTALPSASSRTNLLKEKESKSAREIRKGYDRSDYPEVELPPPAYGYEPAAGYPNHPHT
ncbi:hypothetical protein BD779DRAFT_1540295 [Infundibulicybe gibba]|nr:hypothetical protein BD779DRAFT_1540295 [Infundibulicybe gibba]